MLDFMVYLKWYLSLNGVIYYSTNTNPPTCSSVLTVYNDSPTPREIKEVYFYFKKDNEVLCIQKGIKTTSPENRLCLIHPSIKKKDLDGCVLEKFSTFFLSSESHPLRTILKEHHKRLSTPFYLYNLVLLDPKKSQAIVDYFFNTEDPQLTLTLRYHTPLLHKTYILSCLTVISVCVLSIFYLVCGIYSTKNPIVTEFELNRFRVVKYKEVGKETMESCLICFDTFYGEDEVRVLLCKHYFHKDCVDKWLCEQSSRCPYCRCTNKLYEEIV